MVLADIKLQNISHPGDIFWGRVLYDLHIMTIPSRISLHLTDQNSCVYPSWRTIANMPRTRKYCHLVRLWRCKVPVRHEL